MNGGRGKAREEACETSGGEMNGGRGKAREEACETSGGEWRQRRNTKPRQRRSFLVFVLLSFNLWSNEKSSVDVSKLKGMPEDSTEGEVQQANKRDAASQGNVADTEEKGEMAIDTFKVSKSF